MAVFRSVRKLIPRSSNSIDSVTLSLSSSSSSSAPLPSPFNHFLSHPFLLSRSNLLSKWRVPFHGPLFLSSTPWKLSQSATPLYAQSDFDCLPKVEPFNFLPRPNFPVNLGLASAVSAPRLFNVSSTIEFSDSGEVAVRRTGFTEGFVNFPNLISMSRLLSGPLLGWMIIHEMYLSAFVGLGISGATDWLDGYMARKMGINSVVGSYLDPLADKVLIGCVALAMVDKVLLHPGLVGLVVLRDVALIGGAVYKRATTLDWKWRSWSEFINLDGAHPQKVEPLLISKVNTVFQLVLVAFALLQPILGTDETQLYITYLSWLVASTTVGSTVAYGVQHLKRRSSMIRKS